MPNSADYQPDCLFCALGRADSSQRRTRWFLADRDGELGVVVEDEDAKGWAMRLLYVPPDHVPCGQETAQMRHLARALLRAVAGALDGYEVVGYDLDRHLFTAHWHGQACLVEVKG